MDDIARDIAERQAAIEHNEYLVDAVKPPVQIARSRVGWPDFDQDLQRQILDLAEPPASFTVQYLDAYRFDHDDGDYSYVDCEITWCFARKRKDIFTSEVEVNLTRRVLPDKEPDEEPDEEPDRHLYQRRSAWLGVTEDEKTACVQRLTNEHRWSDVVTISFIPELVPIPSWDRIDNILTSSGDIISFRQTPDVQWFLELVRLHDTGYGIFRFVVQLPEWLRAWPDERRDSVDEALETRLHLQRYTGFGRYDDPLPDEIDFELE